jgi:hypothetical protein
VFVALVRARNVRIAAAADESGKAAARAAYGRAVGALAQLPMEFEDGGARFDRSLWRHVEVPLGVEKAGLHCEHPWGKHLTHMLLRRAVESGVAAGASESDLIDAVKDILDARQATVTLPTLKVRRYGVRGGKTDGFSRYAEAIEAGRIVHRGTGAKVTLEQMHAEDMRRAAQVDAALNRVGAKVTYADIRAEWVATQRRRQKRFKVAPAVIAEAATPA